ncbi:MAG TPA: pitrilysin family protein [Candidatus Eisenbacteria bacterium]|nr:pitrilysin family protein [Candidatus Eisenbacteria bacterium]
MIQAAHSPVFETTLENGLKVLIQEVRLAPVVSFAVWYRVGSRNESAGITGISHLLEHMMFKGTPRFGKGEIARSLQRIGASFNAGTSLDYTCYYETLKSDQLELAMEIESDRMVNASIPDEEHRLEMTVVRSELERNEDNPHRAIYQETFATAFQAHPYHWPTIGWRSDVEAITTEQIRRYYRAHYAPNNAIVVVVGDIEREAALARVKHWFGGIPRAELPPPVTTTERPQQGERRFRLRKPGDTSLVLAAWRNPEMAHPDTHALDVLGLILGHGRTSRLHRALVETGLATEADAANESARDPFLVVALATAAPEKPLAEVEAAMLREVERLRAEPVTDVELRRAKKQVEAGFLYSKDSIQSLSHQLGYYETIASWRFLEEYPAMIRAVTAADVQRVAATYLTEDARTVGWFDPPAASAGEAADRRGAAGGGA